jgi:hypothetical protein
MQSRILEIALSSGGEASRAEKSRNWHRRFAIGISRFLPE